MVSEFTQGRSGSHATNSLRTHRAGSLNGAKKCHEGWVKKPVGLVAQMPLRNVMNSRWKTLRFSGSNAAEK